MVNLLPGGVAGERDDIESVKEGTTK